MTGSGKTTLARRLVSSRENAIVIDSKHELQWSGFQITNSIRAAINGKHIIFRPESSAHVDILLQWIYKAGGWDVYIDEVYTLGRGSTNSYPQSYIALLTRGRSRHITVWTGTQRPVFLPKFAFTESRHFFIMELGSADDSKHIARMAGAPILADIAITGHDYIYYKREGKIAIRSRLGKDDIR